MIGDLAAIEFTNAYGAQPLIVATAPGRVNLIGEHTDYNEGFVFPMAIDRGVAAAARPVGSLTKVVSKQFGAGPAFDANAVEPGDVEGWAAYAASVAWSLRQAGFRDLPNLEAAVFGDLPTGSGVSSSAALEVAFAALWTRIAGLEVAPLELAKICQRAEAGFVGVNCGIMDQLASATGRKGSAMFIDTRSLDVRYAEMPPNLKVVLCDTGMPRQLVDSAYNQRRAECERAASALGVGSLRDATFDDLMAHQHEMDPTVFRRARHVVTENTRCQSFYWALEDRNELRIGLLMRASHESLREDFEVTSKELDDMAEACWSAPGCVGARMTGAGFGGSCVALVREGDIGVFRRSVSNRYGASSGKTPQFLICEAAEGVRVASPS